MDTLSSEITNQQHCVQACMCVCVYAFVYMYIIIYNLSNQPYDKLLSMVAAIDRVCIAFGLFFTL